ncbi:MAG: pilus assembly protein N-terminal domain-containing protein [Acidobacteria bacterium]|nr:pilus assembly protein N-terminal domain-containing protein [Acidobacteriota bacterium]
MSYLVLPSFIQRSVCRSLLAWTLVSGIVAWGQPVKTEPLSLKKSQHLRVGWSSDIKRVAVGDSAIVSAVPIESRHLLLLGKAWGRTSLIVWLKDGSIREYPVVVQRDISLLDGALKMLAPAIRAEIAPDRDAVVLTGTVPDLATSRAAEALTHSYLDATDQGRSRTDSELLLPAGSQGPAPPPGTGPPTVRTVARNGSQSNSAVINLLRLVTLPLRTEERLAEAIKPLGGLKVSVRRILKSALPDDENDTFVLEGEVANQVTLVRVVLIAVQTVTGKVGTAGEIKALVDEAGGLTAGAAGGGQQQSGGSGGGGRAGGSSGGGGQQLKNQVGRNLARAKALEAGGGRVLSFLLVRDLPQVRVNIRLYEVNRNKLRSHNPRLGALTSSTKQSPLSAPALAQDLQGGGANEPVAMAEMLCNRSYPFWAER